MTRLSLFVQGNVVSDLSPAVQVLKDPLVQFARERNGLDPCNLIAVPELRVQEGRDGLCVRLAREGPRSLILRSNVRVEQHNADASHF